MMHIRRMLMIFVALAAAGAIYMYIIPYIMHNRADNVEIQSNRNCFSGNPCPAGFFCIQTPGSIDHSGKCYPYNA